MADYTELVKKLRNRRVCLQTGLNLDNDYPLLREAADAIEKLSTYSDFYEELTDRGIKGIRELLNKFPTPPKEEHSPVYESLKRGLEQAINGENREVVVTNGDKIRSMSDYDLADWIAEILTYHGALYTQRDRFECDQECPLYKCCNDQPTDNIEGWLKLPADLPVMYYPQVDGITPTIIPAEEGKG